MRIFFTVRKELTRNYRTAIHDHVLSAGSTVPTYPPLNTAIWIVLSAVEEALTIKIPSLVMYGVTKTLWLVVTPVAVHVAIAVVLAIIEPMVTVQVPNCISLTTSPTLLTLTVWNAVAPVEDAVAKLTAPVVVRFSSPKLIAPVSELMVGNLTVPVEDAVVRTRLPVRVVTPVTLRVDISERAPVEENVDVAV
ncbi:MAG: hypothetical protein AAB927_02080, partial [Patescibacteria group bacterium]